MHGERDTGDIAPRIELAQVRERILEGAERGTDRRRETVGERGGGDAAPVRLEQGIVELRAEAADGVAHRRLRERQEHRGAAQVPLAIHDVEDVQEVQIELAQLG